MNSTSIFKKVFAILSLTLFFIQPLLAGETYDMISQFEADYRALLRKYTVRESEEYYSRFDQFFQDWKQRISQVNSNELSDEGKIDHLLLNNLIERNIYFLQKAKAEYENVRFVASGADPLYHFMVERRRGNEPSGKSVAADFMAVNAKILVKMDSLKAKPFSSWQAADKAADVIVSLKKNLKEAYDFYYGYDPDFTWWVEKPYDSLTLTLEKYQKFLRDNFVNTEIKDDGSGIIGKPIGREEIIKRLRFEFIPYTPEELIKMAEEQFKWCEKEMLKASAELGYGNDWKAALEKVKNTYVPPGEQPHLIDSLAEEATNFVERNNLITVPPLAKETWRMEMMSPKRQEINPFFTGGEVISISYPTNGMDQSDKMMSMRGNNPYFSRATVHHELIPGHHLQQFMNARYRPYRDIFSTPFWIEGWSLYWEINLWEKGFAQTPEEKIGMLFWRMHRCARIIFSLNYHLGKMTPQQCIDLLVDKVGHEYANAEAEVRRSFTGDYGPLYQIAYMVGGLQFYALHKDLVDTGKMTERDFHDQIMKEGCIPVAMVRAILMHQPPKKDYKAEWRFADNIKFR